MTDRFQPTLWLTMIILGCMVAVTVAVAQPDPPPLDPVAEAVEKAAPAIADEPAPPASVSTEEMARKLSAAESAYEKLLDERRDGDGDPTKFLWVALIAALANLLLGGMKIAMNLGKGKRYLPWAASGIGVVVGGLAYFAGGSSIFDAILYGAGPPFAVVIQELVPLIRSSTPPANG